MSNPLPTTFSPGQEQSLAITLDGPALSRMRRRERMKQELIEAKELEKHGTKVMKIKLRALAAIGADVEQMGVKKVGHGKIAISGDMAHVAVEYLVDLVHELKTRQPPVEPTVVIDALNAMRVFNQQLMDSGKAHLDADKQPVSGNIGPHLSVPFPAGTPLVVGIAPSKPVPIEDSKA